VIAGISEEWVTPVDTRMEALGGIVFRTARKTVEHDQRAQDVATLRAEIAQLKAEHATARADRKAKLTCTGLQRFSTSSQDWTTSGRSIFKMPSRSIGTLAAS
jgi:hypothetical protein